MNVLPGTLVQLRPPVPADGDVLRAIHSTAEVAAWWGPPPEGFPLDEEPGTTRLVIEREGEPIGLIQFDEETDPDYRHARIDLFVDPRHQRKGVGLDALQALVAHLTRDLGHHRVTIDPAADNAAAIGCYEKAGFRPVGVMQAAWRDPASGRWRDVLLMELVVPAGISDG